MKRSSGSSLVEFALVLPILLFILVTMIELCLVVHNYLVVFSAAQKGARMAAVGSSDSEVKAIVDEALGRLINTYLLKGKVSQGVTITPPEVERRVGKSIVVTIDYKVWVNIGSRWTDVLKLEFPVKVKMPIESSYRVG